MLLEDSSTIKMIDFGTARDLGRTAQGAAWRPRRSVYTEGYAPPEQIVGKPEPRSDLFALAGDAVPPGDRQGARGLLHRPASSKRSSPTPTAPSPAEQRWFYELIKINLAEDVNDRYFSASEIKADLDKRQVTREVACPKCQTTNKVREPYCVKCAEPLTDATPPCHHCGKANRMGSRCCIHCGNRLR